MATGSTTRSSWPRAEPRRPPPPGSGSAARSSASPGTTRRRPFCRSVAEDVEQDRAFLRLVQLEQQQPLPPAEQRLAPLHGDGVGGGAEHHLGDVGLAVLALVPLLEVLGPALQVVVG